MGSGVLLCAVVASASVANGLRVVLSPVPFPEPGEESTVLGVRVALTTFGAGKSKAPDSGQAPAILKLHARYLRRVREEQATEFEQFASLSGQIGLRGPDKLPVFLNDKESGLGRAMVYNDPIEAEAKPTNDAPAAKKPRRVLSLTFDESQFEDIRDRERINEHLVLPREPEGTWHHAEIQAVLEVDGVEEAPLGTTGIVDIPLLPTTVFPLPAQKPNAVFLEGSSPEPVAVAGAAPVGAGA